MNRIGILAGAFDPIHSGHLIFVEQVIVDKTLDKVYLLVEKKPVHKPVFASFDNRVQMLELAVKNQPKIEVYDCPVENYPISHCLPEIKKTHPSAKFYLLLGHDVAEHIKSWPEAEKLLDGVEIVVATREDGITSGKIRNSLVHKLPPSGLSPEVLRYISQNRLYGSDTLSGA